MSEPRDFLRQVIDINPSFIFVKDRDGRFTLVNEAVASAYGTTVEGLLGRTDADFNPNAEEVARFRRDDLRVMDTRRELLVPEEVVTDSEGRVRYLQTIKRPLVDEDGVARHVLGVATDVTLLKEAEAKRLEMERSVREAQRLESLGVLAGGIAHDFNNLLVGVLTHAEVASRRLAGASGDPADSIGHIKAAAEHAAELCRQLLAYSGRGRFQVEALDLSRIVAEMHPLLGLTVGRPAALVTELAPDLPAVEADAAQVRQVILNLLTNASEAMAGRRGTIRVATGEQALDGSALEGASDGTPDARYVYVEVEDSGPGMPDVVRARMLEPFFSTKGHGRGLGLAAVQGIVRGHRGVLRVDSEPGRGTRVRFLLPASAGPVPRPDDGARGAKTRAASGGIVLVVDDKDFVVRAVRAMLEADGFEVEGTTDPEEAIRRFAGAPSRYDACVVDLMMPGKTGVEVLEAMRAVRGDIRVILMSGYDEGDALRRREGARPTAFLQKPFAGSALVDAIRS